MSLFNLSEKAYLLLANGRVFEGRSFGAKGTVIGEVVFTTGVTAYQETLTDPSNFGQLVAQTFPLIGNYGVNDEDDESNSTYLNGYIVREWCNSPSNFRSEGNINDFLIRKNVVGIHGIDTRALTRTIRDQGVMNGMITTEDVYANKEKFLAEINAFSIKNAVKTVTVPGVFTYEPEQAELTVVLVDFGYKRNIRRMLLSRGCRVIVVPATTTAEEIKKLNPGGILLSNGPGDPAENTDIIENIREFTKLGIPIFGICLGHLMLALAHGASCEKLKYGHRGANQPVLSLAHGTTYVTSQNHGYTLVNDSLDASVMTVTHVNANDKTCEGVRYLTCDAHSVQFHPEAHNGPLDDANPFDAFIIRMKKRKEER